MFGCGIKFHILTGIEYTIEINEKRFVPWRSVIAARGKKLIAMIAGDCCPLTYYPMTSSSIF
jgi:hypothetical protein